MLPTQTAVATFVDDSTIQVWSSSLVPVLPITGVPSRGFEMAPVPLPVMTPCSTYAAVAATFGSSTCVHVVAGIGRSTPSASVTRSIALGWQ